MEGEMGPAGATSGKEPDTAPETGAAAMQRLRIRLSALMTRMAPYVVSIDGILLIVVGVYALIASTNTFQGEGFLLVVGGIALIVFGLMMIVRWNLTAVRTGLIGLTAGYFASALTEFQVATDPCDIGATLERCAGHVAGGTPWIVYQGPLILAMLLFAFIAFESQLAAPRDIR
jgi:hypothetical protein